MKRAARVASAIALCGLMLGSESALAQDSYPVAGRTLRLITPHGAGSCADILSRLVGPKLAERWKLTAITDNRTGASGDIGIVAAAGAEPDGYTLLCVATVFTLEAGYDFSHHGVHVAVSQGARFILQNQAHSETLETGFNTLADVAVEQDKITQDSARGGFARGGQEGATADTVFQRAKSRVHIGSNCFDLTL